MYANNDGLYANNDGICTKQEWLYIKGAEDHYTHVASEFGCVGVDLWRTGAVADTPDYNGTYSAYMCLLVLQGGGGYTPPPSIQHDFGADFGPDFVTCLAPTRSGLLTGRLSCVFMCPAGTTARSRSCSVCLIKMMNSVLNKWWISYRKCWVLH